MRNFDYIEDLMNDKSFYKYSINIYVNGRFWSEIKTINFGAGSRGSESSENAYFEYFNNKSRYDIVKKLKYIVDSKEDEGSILKIELISTNLLTDKEEIIIEDTLKLNNSIMEDILKERGEIK